jgi:hypothetical protein
VKVLTPKTEDSNKEGTSTKEKEEQSLTVATTEDLSSNSSSIDVDP